MSDPIRPDRLMIQAKVLAGYGAGRGRPSPTNHRRAVSAAYYAVFHTIIATAVLRILPADVATDEDRLRASRWIQHADIMQSARWVVADCPKATAQRHVNAADNALALLAAHEADPYVARFLALVVFRSRRLP